MRKISRVLGLMFLYIEILWFFSGLICGVIAVLHKGQDPDMDAVRGLIIWLIGLIGFGVAGLIFWEEKTIKEENNI